MGGFVAQSGQDDQKDTLKEFSDIETKMEPGNTKEIDSALWRKLNYAGKVLVKAFGVFFKTLFLFEIALVPIALIYIHQQDTDFGKLLKNITERLQNRSLETDFVYYVVNLFPWSIYAMLVIVIDSSLYLVIISKFELKSSITWANIWFGHIIHALAVCYTITVIVTYGRLYYLGVIPEFTFYLYLYVMILPLPVCMFVIRVNDKDFRKSLLGINDPRTFSNKFLDHLELKTHEADAELEKNKNEDIEYKVRVIDAVLGTVAVILFFSPLNYPLWQKFHLDEIKEEIAKDANDLSKELFGIDIKSHVEDILYFCEYLVFIDFMFLVYIFLYGNLLTKTKSFSTAVHIVTGTLIGLMTFCCAIFLSTLLMQIAMFAFVRCLLETSFADMVYMLFFTISFWFSTNTIIDFVREFGMSNSKKNAIVA